MFSDRIDLLADLVAFERAADVGTDHAYVPIKLLKDGRCSFVVASDINEGPLKIAQKNMEAEGLDKSSFSLRLGPGLKPIEKGEVDSIVIAGMGGETMMEILSDEDAKSRSFRQYVLQPRTKAELLRRWLVDNKYYIVNEVMVKELQRYCQVLDVRTEIPEGRESEVFSSDLDLLYPPFLMRRLNEDTLIREWAQFELLNEEKILDSIASSAEPDKKASFIHRQRIDFLSSKIDN